MLKNLANWLKEEDPSVAERYEIYRKARRKEKMKQWAKEHYIPAKKLKEGQNDK